VTCLLYAVGGESGIDIARVDFVSGRPLAKKVIPTDRADPRPSFDSFPSLIISSSA
jgi:hypothetical protein